MNIYTRRGDLGETALLGGRTASKDELIFELLGCVDELQAQLGMARSLASDSEMRKMLRAVQEELVTIGTRLASPAGAAKGDARDLAPAQVERLERWIDALCGQYGLPKGFVIPGDAVESAALHVARTVCRRCERRLVQYSRAQGGRDHALLAYFNRLGDLLFTMAWAAQVRTLVRNAVLEVLREEACA